MTSAEGTNMPALDPYLQQLASYFERQRWFSGKGRRFEVHHIARLPWLPSPSAEHENLVRVELVTVRFADGTVDTYQFPTAYLPEPDSDLGHAFVGTLHDPDLGDLSAYDAVHFKPATEALLRGFLEQRTEESMRFCLVAGAELPADDPPGAVMTGEQSNTSVAYGEEAILKLFRRVAGGHNPDIEIHDALTRDGCEHVAPLLGWIEGTWSDHEGGTHRGDLGMLQVFLRTAADGWSLALASVRDLFAEEDLHPDEVGGDFAAESHRLGEATALVHQELARAFDSDVLDQVAAQRIVEGMQTRLERAVNEVPELADFAAGLRRRFDALGSLGQVPIQRVHGDLHLGQTLRTVKNWKIIDFEGEPAKSLADRVSLDSPLRDVAGMLRSFDYAAGASLQQFGTTSQLAYRAEEWTQRNQQAFLAGYSSTLGAGLRHDDALLLAYEADKAIYEAVYEARNRPGWLVVPLRAVERIAAEG